MKGKLVSLRWPGSDDYPLIAEWIRPLSATAVLTTDAEAVSPEEVRELNQRGRVGHLMVDRLDGGPVGVVSWQPLGSPGGYSIGSAVGDPRLWSRGYGAEATMLLLDYLFHERNAHRVQATTALFNKHSMSVLARGEFVLEGVLRRYHYLDGEYHDATVWSMLREEYYAVAARMKQQHPELTVTDLVPAADKAEGRQLLDDYLASRRPTSLDGRSGHGHDGAQR